MVSSNINPKINYVENRTIEDEDKGHASSVYEIELFDIPIAIVIGKPKYTFAQHDVIFYPIYIISNDKIKSQIGVFEIETNKALSVVDNDGDLELSKINEPIVYSFVNEKFIKKSNSNPQMYDVVSPVKPLSSTTSTDSSSDDSSSEDELDKIGRISKKKKSSKEKDLEKEVETERKKGIFIIDKNFVQPDTLIEETTDIDVPYKENVRDKWIAKFMKNEMYNIQEVETNGDCFFAVIRDAFKSIGQNTTVDKMRTLLSNETTDEIYREQRLVYTQLFTEQKSIEKQIEDIKKINAEYKKRMKHKKITIEESNQIQEEVNKLKIEYAKKKQELQNTVKMIDNDIGYMKNIDTMDKYKDYIKTSSFWADAWAISTIENLLNIKVIIFSETAYTEKAYDSVMNCGEINSNIEKTGTFKPDFYIMATYSGDHYRLITYKNKKILGFTEIPYKVKIMIVKKCLEKNSGIYYLIQDFRNFKAKLGIDADEGAISEDVEADEHMINSELYSLENVFTFHIKAQIDPKPGKGSNEKVAKDQIAGFIPLSKIPEWRRKLSDWWVAPFKVDGHRWSSVEHYIQAVKFKKGYPDFYVLFSLDNGENPLTTDPTIAHKTGEMKLKKFLPKNVKVDTDYDLGRGDEERKVALLAKFSQNPDLNEMLKLTKNARLDIFKSGSAPKPDIELMRVRKEIMDR
jgi:hypothetical protein